MLNVEYISEFGISSTIISIQSLSINFIHNIQVGNQTNLPFGVSRSCKKPYINSTIIAYFMHAFSLKNKRHNIITYKSQQPCQKNVQLLQNFFKIKLGFLSMTREKRYRISNIYQTEVEQTAPAHYWQRCRNYVFDHSRHSDDSRESLLIFSRANTCGPISG